MTRREIAALCCRVVALIVLAWGIMYLVIAIQAIIAALAGTNSGRYGSEAGLFSGEVKYYGTFGCALLLYSMALTWKAPLFSAWMASDDSTPVTRPELSAEALMPVACAGVGLYAITRALPTFTRAVVLMLSTDTTLDGILGDDDWKVSLLADGLLAAWGLWLMLGNRGLVRLLMWARSARSPTLPPEPPQQTN